MHTQEERGQGAEPINLFALQPLITGKFQHFYPWLPAPLPLWSEL